MSETLSLLIFDESSLDEIQAISGEIRRPISQLANTGTRYAQAVRNFLLGMTGMQLAVEQMERDLDRIQKAEQTIQKDLFGLNATVHQWQQEHEVLCLSIQELENMKEDAQE
ncbi:MAG: hypothetical protein ACE5OZ_19050 [Candidatus Heimdallarchaeota archaeon]